ncbi:MAG: hypothetical protein LBU68_01500 [Rickettsiales bacterium]|nr:hypothetical protein [Rickettsiales bacterium]
MNIKNKIYVKNLGRLFLMGVLFSTISKIDFANAIIIAQHAKLYDECRQVNCINNIDVNIGNPVKVTKTVIITTTTTVINKGIKKNLNCSNYSSTTSTATDSKTIGSSPTSGYYYTNTYKIVDKKPNKTINNEKNCEFITISVVDTKTITDYYYYDDIQCILDQIQFKNSINTTTHYSNKTDLKLPTVELKNLGEFCGKEGNCMLPNSDIDKLKKDIKEVCINNSNKLIPSCEQACKQNNLVLPTSVSGSTVTTDISQVLDTILVNIPNDKFLEKIMDMDAESIKTLFENL